MKNIYHLVVALLANLYYGFPGSKLTVIGVTGTDGKTTTTHMIYEMLKGAGKKVSMLSTIQAVVGGEAYDTGFHVTTPDPHVLPKFLREAVKHGDEYFVLEVSSHALDQNRVAFTRFAIGVLTNLSHEHLDYHKTFARYANAKFSLLRRAQEAVVLPQEGVSKEALLYAEFDNMAKDVFTFGMQKGKETQEKWQLKLSIPGDFNILNALSAASVGVALKLDHNAVKKALEQFKGIAGRYEEMPTGKDFRVVIDFAHKPNALEQVLKTARGELKADRASKHHPRGVVSQHPRGGRLAQRSLGKVGMDSPGVNGGRLIVMYGCASERDVFKRSMMGEISGRLADITVLTDEDPRFEDSMKIIEEIEEGLQKVGAKEDVTYFKIPNRAKAIEFIIQKLARKGDIVLLCGKGHEKSINYRGTEEPWSEEGAVRKALAIFQ